MAFPAERAYQLRSLAKHGRGAGSEPLKCKLRLLQDQQPAPHNQDGDWEY